MTSKRERIEKMGKREISNVACMPHPMEYYKDCPKNRPLIASERCLCKNCAVHKMSRRQSKTLIEQQFASLISQSKRTFDDDRDDEKDDSAPDSKLSPFLKDWVPKGCCCGCQGGCCVNPQRRNLSEPIIKYQDSDSDYSDSDDDDDDRFPMNVATRADYNKWIESFTSYPGHLCHWPRSCPAACLDHPPDTSGIKPFLRDGKMIVTPENKLNKNKPPKV